MGRRNICGIPTGMKLFAAGIIPNNQSELKQTVYSSNFILFKFGINLQNFPGRRGCD
jgi:hypothetical protein